MNTTTTAPAALTHPKLRAILMQIEGRSDEHVMAYDWLDADGELRSVATQAPMPKAYTKVDVSVEWHDGLKANLRIDLSRGDQLKSGNMLVTPLRDQARFYLNEDVPGGWEAAVWSAHLVEVFKEHLPALQAKWRKVLDRLPVEAEVSLAEVEDVWGGEAAATELPSISAPANDATPEPAPTAAPKAESYGRGFVGSKYVSGRDTAETAALIRAELKELGAKGTAEIPKGTKFRVRIDRFAGGSSIDVKIIPPADFMAVNEARVRVDLRLDPDEGPPVSLLTPQGLALVAAVEKIRESYGFDDSDTMTDYFHVDYYGSSEIDWEFREAQRKVIEERLRAHGTKGEDPWTGDVTASVTTSPVTTPAFRPTSEKLPALATPAPKRVTIPQLPYQDPIPPGRVAEEDLHKLLKVALPYKKGRLDGTFFLYPKPDGGMGIEVDATFCGKVVCGSMRFKADGQEDFSCHFLRDQHHGVITRAARDAVTDAAEEMIKTWGRAHPQAFEAARRRDAESDVAMAEGEVKKLLQQLEKARAEVVSHKARLAKLGGPLLPGSDKAS